jgi:hypothetical protein
MIRNLWIVFSFIGWFQRTESGTVFTWPHATNPIKPTRWQKEISF